LLHMLKETQNQTSYSMSPSQFGAEYTEYYHYQDSDSPERARKYLIEQLIIAIKQKLQLQEQVTILDIGAGKQKLEAELQATNDFIEIQEKVKIITLDIAHFDGEKSLLAKEILHLEANGAELPFADHTFDIVFSCMAIDFMPRLETFSELKRVLKLDGSACINFHHPSLMVAAESQMQVVRKERRTAMQKIRFAQNSKKYSQYEEKLEQVAIEIRDIQFILYVFPHLVFYSTQDIIFFLRTVFPEAEVTAEEFIQESNETGWFGATVTQQ